MTKAYYDDTVEVRKPFERKFRRGDIHIARWDGSPPSLVIIDDHISPNIVQYITIERFFEKPPSSVSNPHEEDSLYIRSETNNIDLLDPEPVGNIRNELIEMAKVIANKHPNGKGIEIPTDKTV